MTSSPSSVFFIYLLLTLLLTVSSDLQEDRNALLKFMANVGHASKTNWHKEADTCEWSGVMCTSDKSSVIIVRIPGAGLVGKIPPDSLGKIKSLRVLSLHNNNLSGPIPDDFASLTELRYVYLQNNNFSGQFPSSVAKWTNLRALDLSGNSFTGTVPHDLSHLTMLRNVSLQNNDFSGQFPSSVAYWTNLLALDLSGNSFTGTVPHDLSHLTMLRNVSLQNNKFSGQLPSSVAHWTNLLALDLSGNNFIGPIPENLSTKFPEAAFFGNIYLCCDDFSYFIIRPCEDVISKQWQSPFNSPTLFNTPSVPRGSKKEEKLCTTAIVVIAVGSALILLILLSYVGKEWSRHVKEKNAAGVATMAAKAAGRGFGKLD